MWQTSWAAQANDEAISHWPHRKLSFARMKINKKLLSVSLSYDWCLVFNKSNLTRWFYSNRIENYWGIVLYLISDNSDILFTKLYWWNNKKRGKSNSLYIYIVGVREPAGSEQYDCISLRQAYLRMRCQSIPTVPPFFIFYFFFFNILSLYI